MLEYSTTTQFEQGANLSLEQLYGIMNLDTLVPGKNVSMKNDFAEVFQLTVNPEIGKQIIKFDRSSQSIDVKEYDERFEGNYTVTLKVISEKRIRVLKFDIEIYRNETKNMSFNSETGMEIKEKVSTSQEAHMRSVENGKKTNFTSKISLIDE